MRTVPTIESAIYKVLLSSGDEWYERCRKQLTGGITHAPYLLTAIPAPSEAKAAPIAPVDDL
jgi:hypothetical protein